MEERRAKTSHELQPCNGIALTFDLCPVKKEPGFDEALVNLLINRRIPATFFISGRWAARHEDQLRKLLAFPLFDFGTHGYRHRHLPELDWHSQREEIMAAILLLRERFGRETFLFRPPFGEYDHLTLRLMAELGLNFVLWDVVSGDPNPKLSREAIATKVINQTSAGDIVVFHANGKGKHTRAVVEDVYNELTPRGLIPMTVTQLLQMKNGANSKYSTIPARR